MIIWVWGDRRRACNAYHVIIYRELLRIFSPNTYLILKTSHTQKTQLLGINIFTYILAALIVFFLSMNAIFGVGWLGQSLGWEDVGTFTKVSDSLPLDVDVSGDDYLLQ